MLNAHNALIIAFNELSRHDRSKLETDPYFHNEGFASTYELQVKVIDQLITLLAPELLVHRLPNQFLSLQLILTSNQPLRLPHIDLPKFNGSLVDWFRSKICSHL